MRFRIDEIRFFTAATKRDKNENKQISELKILERKSNAKNKTTEILIDGGELPVREVILTTADRNFRREVTLQIPDKSTTDRWHTITRSPRRGKESKGETGAFHLWPPDGESELQH